MQQINQRKCFSRVGWYQAVVCVNWLLVLALLVLITAGCGDTGTATIITAQTSEQEMPDETEMSEPGTDESSLGETVGEMCVTTAWIYVHVCGQVTNPGVYLLSEGSRMWDAIEAAGGFLPEAASQAVNLAMMVADGSKVTIPDVNEAQENDFRWYETAGGKVLTVGGASVGDDYDSPSGVASGSVSDSRPGRIDINRADAAALMTIPGIGESRANAIVSYRETRGPFGSIEEIMNVTGIKEGLFAKIKEYITVGG